MTVRATPVKMVALVLMASTPTNVFVVMDGKERIVKQVSKAFFAIRTLGDVSGKNSPYCLSDNSRQCQLYHKLSYKGCRGQCHLFSTESHIFE